MRTIVIFFLCLFLFACGSKTENQNPNAEEQQILHDMKTSLSDTTKMEIVMERDTTD